MYREMVLFFLAMAAGALMVLLYGLLIAFRKVIPHVRAAAALEDVLFWLISALVLFVCLYRANQGILRCFLLLGMILGAGLCRCTAAPLFIRCAAVILGIPVFFAKITTNRLLFLVKRCRIYRYKFANSAGRHRKLQVTQSKRSGQVGKIRKRK